MKTTITKILGVSVLLVLSAGSALAATITLTNGGLGQVASNPQQFGVAVCSSQTLSQSVPVNITVVGKTATINSVPMIKSGACEYSYVDYAQFGMEAGKTYDVDVVIDPQHSISSNSNNETVYSVTVPGNTTTAVANSNANLTANISSQFSNPLVAFWQWLGDLYRSL